MDLSFVREALHDEADSIHKGVDGLSVAEWELPTRCAPWSVRELLGHVRVALAWLPDMLAAPEPGRAEVSAAGYYRPDARFAPQANATRIELARKSAAGLTAGFHATAELVDTLCRAEREDRVVRTRHGDAMGPARPAAPRDRAGSAHPRADRPGRAPRHHVADARLR